MNRNEQRRTTTLPLPNPGEKNLQTVVRMLNNAVLDLQKKDSDKEVRVRALEAKQDRGSAKYAPWKHVGRHWFFREPEDNNGIPLKLFYSADGTMPSDDAEPTTTFTP